MLSRTLCERYLVPEQETISTTTISLCCKSMHFVAWCRGRRKCTRFRTSSVRPSYFWLSYRDNATNPPCVDVPAVPALSRFVPARSGTSVHPHKASICNQIEQFNDGTVSTKPGHSTLF